MSKKNKKWDASDPKNHQVRRGGPGASLGSIQMPMEQALNEDSPLEAPVGGHARTDKLMSPETRELVLHSRKTEIEAFANDRGLKPDIVAGICEAAMRMGKVPDLAQYGVSGDEAKAIKQFVAGEILNIAIEDLPGQKGNTVAETTSSANAGAAMRLPTAFLERPTQMVDSNALEKSLKLQHESNPALELGTGVSNKPALTIADIAQLAADDAARLRQAAEYGVRPATETTVESASAPKPKGEKIGKALKGLGGKLRSPAEVAPGEFNPENGGTAPLAKDDITVKEDEFGSSVKQLVSLTDAELNEGLRARLADFKSDYKATHAGELEAGAKPGLRTKLGSAAFAMRRTIKGQNKGFGGGMKESQETAAPGASILRGSRVSASSLRDPSVQVESETHAGMPITEAKNFIAKMHMKKGALHKQMGVPKGEKIPAGKLAAAAEKGGKEGKRARLAQTLKKLHHNH